MQLSIAFSSSKESSTFCLETNLPDLDGSKWEPLINSNCVAVDSCSSFENKIPDNEYETNTRSLQGILSDFIDQSYANI